MWRPSCPDGASSVSDERRSHQLEAFRKFQTEHKEFARQVGDEEKARLWPVCVEHYHEFDDYQSRTDRNIPVFDCQPAA